MSPKKHIINNPYDGQLSLDDDKDTVSDVMSFVSNFDKATNSNVVLTEETAETNRSIAPSVNIQTKDKISITLLDKNVVNKGEQFLSMERKGSPVPITTKLNVSLDVDALLNEHPEIIIIDNYEFDYFDKSVFDSFCSLISAGNPYVTYAMIARNILGKPSNHHPSEKMIKNVEESILKMSRTEICIDLSDEYQNFPNVQKSLQKQNDSLYIQERLLNIRIVSANINGKNLRVLQPMSTPALLQYAMLKRQISTFSNETLNTPTNKNRASISCQKFLLQRIGMIKSSQKISRAILFSSIYKIYPDYEEKKDDPTAFRSLTRATQRNVCAILDYWKKIGFIKDYKIIGQKGVKYHKIEIDA